MKKDNLNKEIENILQSSAKQQRVSASPFFTTRVLGRVEQLEQEKVSFPILSYILKPAFVIFILVNVANFYFFADNQESVNQEESIELVSADYNMFPNDFIYSDDLLIANN
jgi:hypothetical protein